ncbi:MAG: hypothetical protein HY287_00585 [Planctomycetes bacterium]|nr:hypothetical protein [Planctomycetota bacterium]
MPDPSINLCGTHDNGIPFDKEFIYELNPEDGRSRLFATIPRELCGGITGMAFSPDGRRLRVASQYIGAILEFDAQGNLSIPLYWRDGIASPSGLNCIAYDDNGNFYVANYGGLNILKFPAGGGPAVVLDEYDPNDVPNHVATPIGLAVALDGAVYVMDYWLTKLVRITPQGQASLWDTFTGHNATLVTLTVDEEGTVFLGETDFSGGSGFYRYFQGAPARQLFVLSLTQTGSVCSIEILNMSMDRTRLAGAGSFVPIQGELCISSIDPLTGSYESLLFNPPASKGMAIVPLRGDIDHSGAANLADYALLQGCLDGPAGGAITVECVATDLDADGAVNHFDFRFFQMAFGGRH